MNKGTPVRATLKHDPNPDIEGGYWQTPLDSRREKAVTVSSFVEASAVCRAYIDRNGLGGGNWTGGEVFADDGTRLGRISYNGRVWDLNAAEIS